MHSTLPISCHHDNTGPTTSGPRLHAGSICHQAPHPGPWCHQSPGALPPGGRGVPGLVRWWPAHYFRFRLERVTSSGCTAELGTGSAVTYRSPRDCWQQSAAKHQAGRICNTPLFYWQYQTGGIHHMIVDSNLQKGIHQTEYTTWLLTTI